MEKSYFAFFFSYNTTSINVGKNVKNEKIDMSLTSHQEEVFNQSLEILKSGKRLLIKGSAGTGKTFLLGELVKHLAKTIPRNKKVYCSAPTNKAVAVIKGKVDPLDNLDFVTVHSALKIKREVNFKTGAITFKPFYNERYPPLMDVALFIIDETSMLNTELLDYVETHATKRGATVIFLGDDKQLNPVGEEESPVFLGRPKRFEDQEGVDNFVNNAVRLVTTIKDPKKDGFICYEEYPTVELTEIIRQGEGNPIIDLSRNLESASDQVDNRVEGCGYIFSENEAQVVETLAAVNGTDELKYLAYTNAEVNKINNLVRKRLYGETPAKIEEGETLIFNEPYLDNYSSKEVKVDKVVVREKQFSYPSGKVKGVFESSTLYSPILLKYYSVNPVEDLVTGNLLDSIIVIHEESEDKYNRLIKDLSQMANMRKIEWVDRYAFSEKFADLNYNHALTIHKSQGSTYKQTIVNLKSIKMNKKLKEKQRLLYTAVTRAADLLILYKNN